MEVLGAPLRGCAAPADTGARYAFLLYDSRSGSTIVSALLNRYRSVSVSLESAFTSRIIEFGRAVPSEEDVAALADFLLSEVQFRELGIPRERVAAAIAAVPAPRPPCAVMLSLLELYFAERDPEAGVRLVKNPPFPYIELLREWLPGVRFIHLVRDGRAVYRSKRTSRSIGGRVMQPNLVKAALTWRRAVRTADARPDCVLTVRYEDLLADADAVMARVLDFLDVPPEARELSKEQHEYQAAIGAAQAHLHRDAGRPPRAAGADNWRSELSPAEIAVYERLAGRDLRRHGYPVGETGAARSAVLLCALSSGAEYVAHRVRNFVRSAVVEGSLREKTRRRWSRWTRGRGRR